MELKDATRAKHRAAEETALSRLMISGTMREHTYAAFLENMLLIYQELERDGLLDHPDVSRSHRVTADLQSLDQPRYGIADSVRRYVSYLANLQPKERWAHIYVHYLGNMYGGQMIGKGLPGQHTHLQFDNLKECIAYVRTNINGINPDEANRAFDWTIEIYDELHQLFG